ncbi:MAG TPA: LamG domain-containing protein [Candidatus Saccharimonadales bacterium]|jgi:hypothetical protein
MRVVTGVLYGSVDAAKAVLAIAALGLLGAAVFPGLAAAESYNSSSYKIDAGVGNSFGGPTSSASYKMVSSGGEAVTGDGSAGSYKLGSGFVSQLEKSIQLNVHPASLLLHYPMDEPTGTKLFDNASGALDATTVGSPSRVVGKLGQALSLNGTTQLAHGGNHAVLDAEPGQARTVSAWIKAGTQSQKSYIVWKNGNCKGWMMSMDTQGNISLEFSSGPNSCTGPTYYAATSSGTVYNNSAWHHVLGVIDRPGGSLRLYVDGQPEASASIDTTNPGGGGEINVGAQYDFSNSFNGLIDEVKVFDKAFSDKDAAREYAAQNAGLASSLSFADLVPNTSVSVAARAIVQTDAPGYTLAISQNQPLTSGGNTISPIGGSIGTPALWTEGTTKGLGFALTSAPSLDAKWGTGPNYKYAQLPGSATTMYSRSGYSGGVKDIIGSQYRLDVPLSLPAGNYQNTVTYTATVLP